MSFSGNVEKKSHEGGLLVAFEGRAPRLGAMIRVVGGKSLGRVNTVIGAVDRALIHIHPLDSEIDAAVRLSKSHRARTAEVVTSVVTVEIAVAINGTIVEDIRVVAAEDIRVVASAMSVETTAAAEIEAIAVAIGPAPNARILTSPSAPNAIVVM